MKFSSSTNIALASFALSPNLLSSPVFASPTPDAGALSPNLNTGCFSGPPQPQATDSPLTQGASVFSEPSKHNAVPTFLITPAIKVAGRHRFIKRSKSAKSYDDGPTYADRGAEDIHDSRVALGVDFDFFGSTRGSSVHIRADDHNNRDDTQLPSTNIASETPPDYNSPPLLGPYPSYPHPVTTPDRLGGLVPAWIYPHGNPVASASPANAGGLTRTVLGTPDLWPIHGLTYSTALADGKKDSFDNRKNQQQVEAKEGHSAQHGTRERQFPPRMLVDLESPFLSSPIPHDEPTFPTAAHTHYAHERVKRDIVPNLTGTSGSNSPQVQKGPSDSLSWTDANGPLLVGPTDPKTIPVWSLPNIAPPPLSGASKLPDGSFGIPVSVPNGNRLLPLPDIGGASVFPTTSAVGDPSVAGTGYPHYIPNVEGIGSAVGDTGAGMGGLTSAIPNIGGLTSGVLGTPNIGDLTNGLPTGSIVNGLLGMPDTSVLPAYGRLSEATKQLDTINPMLKPVADPISSLGTTPLSAPQPGSFSVPGFNAVPIPVSSLMPGYASGANVPVNSLPIPISVSPEQIQPTAPLQTAPNPISVVSGAAQVSNKALGGQGVSDVRGLTPSENNPLPTTNPLMNHIMNPYPLPGTIPLADPGFVPLPSPVLGTIQQDTVGLGGQSVTAGLNRFAPAGSTQPTVPNTDSHVPPALTSLPIPATDQLANVPPLPVSTHPFVVAVDPAPKALYTHSDPSGIVSGAEVAPDDTSSSTKPTLGSGGGVTPNNMTGMVPGLNMPLASKTNNTPFLPSPNQPMPTIDPIRVIPSPPSSVSGMPSGLPSVVTSGRMSGTVDTISDAVSAVPNVGGTIPSTIPSAVFLPLPSETPNPMYSTMPIPDPVSFEDPNKIISHFPTANLHTLSNGLTEPSAASDNNKNEATIGAYKTKQAGMGAMGRPDGFVEVKQTKEDNTDARKDEVAAGNMGKTGSDVEDGLGGGIDKVSTGSKPSHTIENDGNKTARSSSILNSKIETHTESPAFLFSPSNTHSKTLPTITTAMASPSPVSLIMDQTPNKSGWTESLPTQTSHMETPTPTSQRLASWAGPGRRLRVRILPDSTISSTGLPTAHEGTSSAIMPTTKVPRFELIDLPDDLPASSDSNNPATPTSTVTGLPHPTPIYLGGSSLTRMDEISAGLGVIDTTGTMVDPNIGGITGWGSALNRMVTSTLRATATITGEESTPTVGKVLRM